jgi:hypothetical protein
MISKRTSSRCYAFGSQHRVRVWLTWKWLAAPLSRATLAASAAKPLRLNPSAMIELS